MMPKLIRSISAITPCLIAAAPLRVLRGGSWFREATMVRCAFRGQWEPASHGFGGHMGGSGLGLRLVKTN